MAIAKSVDARGDSSHDKRQVLKEDEKWRCVARIDFIMICERILQVLSKAASRLWFYPYTKYTNGNSARRKSSTQRHIRLPICYGGSDQFSSGISRKLPKIATSNIIFSRTADRISTKFARQFRRSSPMTYLKLCLFY